MASKRPDVPTSAHTPEPAANFAAVVPCTPVLAEMPRTEIIEKLAELGDTYTAVSLTYDGSQLRSSDVALLNNIGWNTNVGDLFRHRTEPWEYTEHRVGFLPLNAKPDDKQRIPIKSASAIDVDATLKNSRVDVHLDRLRVAKYPGGSKSGNHLVLFDFETQNHISKDVTDTAHFAQKVDATEGQSAGVIGKPIFVGLSVGVNGLSLVCETVNVGNASDGKLLKFMESGLYQQGLKLATVAQPAVSTLAGLAKGFAELLSQRNANVKVQHFELGLDFSGAATGLLLSQGSYIVAQIDQSATETFNWDDWFWHTKKDQIVGPDGTGAMPYNYVIFRIARYDDGATSAQTSSPA